MARLIGPDEGSREVKAIVGDVYRAMRNKPVTIFADPEGTILADIRALDGAPIPDSVVHTDAYSMLARFQFPPNDVDTVYGSVGGGPIWPIYARTDDRLDGLSAGLTSLAALAVLRAANLGDLADAEAARLNLGLGDSATRNVGLGAGTVAAGNDSRFGVEALPVTIGASWTGAVATSLANTARTVHATLTGSVTLTLPTPSATVSYTVTLVLTQDATGGRTLTLPQCKFAYGVAPVLSTAGGATDVLHLMWTGVQWIALMGAPAVA